DELVTGRREGLRVGRGGAEPAGPAPAAERPQHLEVGVLLLQLPQLVEVAAERVRVGGVRYAVHALLGGVGALVIGPGVADRAASALDVPEGVHQVGQLVGRAARDDVLDVVVAVVAAPVGGVPDDLAAVLCGLGAAGAARRA